VQVWPAAPHHRVKCSEKGGGNVGINAACYKASWVGGARGGNER